MKYVIDMLTRNLEDEKRHTDRAGVLPENWPADEKEAWDRSEAIAKERIPQLEKALKLLTQKS